MILSAAALSLLVALTPTAQESPALEAPLVCFAALDDEAITPVTQRFFARAVETAELEGAECLVLVLDTPGGLVDSTRAMVKTVLGARVPVVVYVPAGGRAASAGLFVTLAAHVAAMAPGSNIGAAHPVQLGALPIGPREGAEPGDPAPGALGEKAVQDTTAWARSLAELRGRSSEWAARAVTESLSASATEALREGVVDLLARDRVELLERLDGRSVAMPDGERVLSTADARTRTVAMWWGERVLAAISNPNVALLLVVFGVYGILFELYSPGWGIAGTLGAIMLCLGFYALSILPVDYAGLLLLALAIGLFVAEAFFTSYGALALGGIVCLVFGGLMLVDSPAGFLRVSLGVVVPVAAATAAITVFLVGGVVRAQRLRVQTGAEAMVGEAAVAREDFVPGPEGFAGTVLAHGELWSALSPDAIHAGDELEVRGREHMVLTVGSAAGREGGDAA